MPLLSPEGRQKLLLIAGAVILVLGILVSTRALRLERRLGNRTPLDRVRTALARRLGVPPERVVPAARLDRDLLPDGVERLELVPLLQEEFGVEVSEQDAGALQTVGDVVSLVERRLSEGRAGTRP